MDHGPSPLPASGAAQPLSSGRQKRTDPLLEATARLSLDTARRLRHLTASFVRTLTLLLSNPVGMALAPLADRREAA